MKVIWQTPAKTGRDNVADYICRQFGAKRKTRFLQEVRHTTQMLRRSPNIGPIDPLFSDRSATYRSIVINGLSKLVYRADDDVIYIVAFWDTRQEPAAQAVKVKEYNDNNQ